MNSKLNAAHWHPAVVRNQREAAFLFEGLQHISQKTNTSSRAEVFGELIQLVGIENVKATREEAFRLSFLVEPVKVF